MLPTRNLLNPASRSALLRGLYALLMLALLLGGPGGALPPAPAHAAEAAPAAPTAVTSKVFLPLVAGDGPGGEPGEDPVSAQQLIRAALAAGQIDYPASLLYRGYAQYASPALPAHLRGDYSDGDHSLFAEIEAALPGLPPEQQTLLSGLLARPTHPDSVVQGPLPLPPAGLAALLESSPLGAKAQSAAAEFQCAPIDDEGTAWGSLASQTIPVRVHSLCYNNANLDAAYTIPLAQLTLQTLEGLWGPMTDFMGVTPLRDGAVADDGGDDLIDFYLLYDNEVYPRGEPSVQFTNAESGFARPLLPRQGPAAPGLVALRRSLAPDAGGDTRQFRMTIAHELFHLLQFARNEQFMHQDYAAYWFVEASATWAGWNFTPDARPLAHDRLDTFQESDLSLHATGPSGSEAHKHTYAAYLWPFFMHQEVNSATIALAWEDMAGAASWEAGDDILNDWVNFRENFPLFALRNLNNKARFGAAIAGHYVDFDPSFPDGAPMPKIEAGGLVLPGDSQAEAVELPALKAKYYHYTVDPEVQRLKVDVSDFEPAAYFKAQMVAKIRGQGWRLIALPEGGAHEFCLDDPEQDIEEFYLVLSNSDRPLANEISGVFTISDLAEPCACGDFGSAFAFIGTAAHTYAYQAGNGQYAYDIQQTVNGEAQLLLTADYPHARTYIGTLAGTGSVNETETDYTVNPPDVETGSASGPLLAEYDGVQQSKFILNVDLQECRYNLVVQSAVATAGGLPHLVGTAYTGWRPAPASLHLSGSAALPAHSVIWLSQQFEPVDAYWPGGGFGLVMFFNVVGLMNQAGEAHFTWDLLPVQ